MEEILKFRFSNKKLMDLSHKIRYNVFVIGQNCPEEIEWEFTGTIHFLLIFKQKLLLQQDTEKLKRDINWKDLQYQNERKKDMAILY